MIRGRYLMENHSPSSLSLSFHLSLILSLVQMHKHAVSYMLSFPLPHFLSLSLSLSLSLTHTHTHTPTVKDVSVLSLSSFKGNISYLPREVSVSSQPVNPFSLQRLFKLRPPLQPQSMIFQPKLSDWSFYQHRFDLLV